MSIRVIYPTEANYGILGNLATQVTYRLKLNSQTIEIIGVFCRSISNENFLNKLSKDTLSKLEAEIIEDIES